VSPLAVPVAVGIGGATASAPLDGNDTNVTDTLTNTTDSTTDTLTDTVSNTTDTVSDITETTDATTDTVSNTTDQTGEALTSTTRDSRRTALSSANATVDRCRTVSPRPHARHSRRRLRPTRNPH
jgi:hypothetical protein